MILIGDIGNTEIKIALYSNSKKLIKNKRINTNFINKQNLNSNFRFLNKYLNSIEKILFCSVVPKKFLLIKNYLSKKTKLKCFELKQLNIEKLINIKVNRKQIGSDRLANAISISKPNKNFIIVDFGTATNFDVVIKNTSGRSRRLEGLDDKNSVFFGDLPEAAISVPMNGAIYKADVHEGQKTGLFYDQRQNHKFVASLANGKTVLDVFCHVGGFGLAAIAAGASKVSFVDSSANALDLVREGASEMMASSKMNIIRGDAFSDLRKLFETNSSYDIVICDPPAFVTSRKSLNSGLRAYEKMAKLGSSLVRENGVLVLCSCSQLADLTKFRNACVRGIGRAGRRAQLIHTGFAAADHPIHLQLLDNSYLKSLVFRL